MYRAQQGRRGSREGHSCVATGHDDKKKIINDLSFDPKRMPGQKGCVNLDLVKEEVPDCLCEETMPTFTG